MIDFSSITTLLFDIDNTLLILDEQEFIKIYCSLIHRYFQKELSDLNKFVKFFLASTQKMIDKEPSHLDNFSKFALDLESKIGVPHTEIINRFSIFYQNEFEQVCRIMIPAEGVFPLLTFASQYYLIVAATNPLFPSVANQRRLSISGLDRFSWEEITSAEHYHFSKPNIEYYEELLEKLGKKPSECIMVGNDPINDMIAGELGIHTFLVTSKNLLHDKILKTKLDYQNMRFEAEDSGTLENFHDLLKEYIDGRQ
ncbi:MAG: HAD family hydrolase [Candidatus Hodarchaeales archaeon]